MHELRLPELPEELIARVFEHLSVRDVNNVRTVCQQFRNIVRTYGSEIWQARCEAVGIIQAAECSVLGACIELLNVAIASTTSAGEHAAMYRAHYQMWAGMLCINCTSGAGIRVTGCSSCIRPENIEWVSGTINGTEFQWSSELDFEISLWSLICPRPPHPPLTWEYSNSLYRLDVLLRAVEQHIGADSARDFDTMLRENGFIVR